MRPLLTGLLTSVALAVAAEGLAAQTAGDLARGADTNGDGSLDQPELVALFDTLAGAAGQPAAAVDFAHDALSYRCEAGCSRIDLGRAADFLVRSGAYHRSVARAADTDADGELDALELAALHASLATESGSSDATAAADFAADALTWQCSSGCLRISIDEVVEYLRDRQLRQGAQEELLARKTKIGWPGLGFSRFVLDAMNPRPAKFTAPTIFSYTRDNEAEKNRDRVTALGGVQLWLLQKDLDRAQLGTFQMALTPGLDFDVDGTKEGRDTSITAGVPIFFTWVFDSPGVESLTLGVKPKFTTDRVFDREVPEVVVSTSITSPAVGAGFIRPAKRTAGGQLSRLSAFWQPGLDIEIGDVSDAAGNEKLQVLEELGRYRRIAARLNAILYPWALSERLRVTVDYFHRFDVDEGWDRGYGEARIDYDLVIDGTLELSAVYRNGRKPPDFARKDEILVGIGIRQ